MGLVASIQPKQRASSRRCRRRGGGALLAAFLWKMSQTPADLAWFLASQVRQDLRVLGWMVGGWRRGHGVGLYRDCCGWETRSRNPECTSGALVGPGLRFYSCSSINHCFAASWSLHEEDFLHRSGAGVEAFEAGFGGILDFEAGGGVASSAVDSAGDDASDVGQFLTMWSRRASSPPTRPCWRLIRPNFIRALKHNGVKHKEAFMLYVLHAGRL